MDPFPHIQMRLMGRISSLLCRISRYVSHQISTFEVDYARAHGWAGLQERTRAVTGRGAGSTSTGTKHSLPLEDGESDCNDVSNAGNSESEDDKSGSG
jgi:hypothetical protein